MPQRTTTTQAIVHERSYQHYEPRRKGIAFMRLDIGFEQIGKASSRGLYFVVKQHRFRQASVYRLPLHIGRRAYDTEVKA